MKTSVAPCPFCGAEDVAVYPFYNWRKRRSTRMGFELFHDCQNMKITVSIIGDTEAECVNTWNVRSEKSRILA